MHPRFSFEYLKKIAANRLLASLLLAMLICLSISIQSAYASPKQYNVVSYGADASGKKDSRSAILAAIAAAQSDGGGIVFFPTGTFLYNNAIFFPSGVSVEGASHVSAVVQPTNSRRCPFVFTGKSSISNLNVDPKRIAASSPIPLMPDIFVNGQAGPTSIAIKDVNAGTLKCLDCSVSISNASDIRLNTILANGCNPLKIMGGRSARIDLDLSDKNIPSQNVSIIGTVFPQNIAQASVLGLSANGVKSLAVQHCLFNNNTVSISGGCNCLFANNSFETNSVPTYCLVVNGVAGSSLTDSSGLVIDNNQFVLDKDPAAEERIIGALISGSKFPGGAIANGKILFANNKLDGAVASFGGKGYTNKCVITYNRLSNGSTLRLTPGSWASGVLGSGITVSNNTFTGSYNIKGRAKDWLISVDSAPFAQEQKLDPLSDGVNIISNSCEISPPGSNTQLGFIWVCTPDPSTVVNIQGNTQSAGLFLPTAQGNSVRSMSSL